MFNETETKRFYKIESLNIKLVRSNYDSRFIHASKYYEKNKIIRKNQSKQQNMSYYFITLYFNGLNINHKGKRKMMSHFWIYFKKDLLNYNIFVTKTQKRAQKCGRCEKCITNVGPHLPNSDTKLNFKYDKTTGI